MEEVVFLLGFEEEDGVVIEVEVDEVFGFQGMLLVMLLFVE